MNKCKAITMDHLESYPTMSEAQFLYPEWYFHSSHGQCDLKWETKQATHIQETKHLNKNSYCYRSIHADKGL